MNSSGGRQHGLGSWPSPGLCHGKGAWPEELAQLSSQVLKPCCSGARVTEWLAEWRQHAFLPCPGPVRTPGHHGACFTSSGHTPGSWEAGLWAAGTLGVGGQSAGLRAAWDPELFPRALCTLGSLGWGCLGFSASHPTPSGEQVSRGTRLSTLGQGKPRPGPV